MDKKFHAVDPFGLKDNVFELIDKDWMLVTAGSLKSWNTMTASWGGLGILWNKPVAFAFVRPTRHTYGFIEKTPKFTLSFFPPKFRKALLFCGTRSGRDCDKAKETGLSPMSPAAGAVSFAEARLVLVCRKLYTTDINPARLIDPKIDKNYPKKDYHRLYIGEVVRCLAK